jgi:rod shape-determining protein MreD
MRWARYLVILLAFVVVEGAMPRVLRPFGAGPDLLLCLAVGLALHADSWRVFGLLWGVGLVRDLTSLGPFGFYALLVGAAGLGLHLLRETVFRHHVLTLIVVGGLFSLTLGLVALLRLALAGGTLSLGGSLLRLLVGALLTGAVAPVVVKGLLRARALSGFVPPEEMEAWT